MPKDSAVCLVSSATGLPSKVPAATGCSINLRRLDKKVSLSFCDKFKGLGITSGLAGVSLLVDVLVLPVLSIDSLFVLFSSLGLMSIGFKSVVSSTSTYFSTLRRKDEASIF